MKETEKVTVQHYEHKTRAKKKGRGMSVYVVVHSTKKCRMERSVMVHNVQVRQNRRRLWPLFSSPSSPSLISSPSSPSSFYICEIIF